MVPPETRLKTTMHLVMVESIVLFAVLGTLVLLVVALLDLVRRPAAAWEASGHNQLVWALVVIFVGFVGPLLYLMVARPALDASSSGGPAGTRISA